jgi:4-hydroxybenzoate polyprenyltransferase
MTYWLPTSLRPKRVQWLIQLLSAIRFDEVLVLQGTPAMGAILALGMLTMEDCFRAAVLAVGNLCLVAHVFVINDWAGIEGDLKDPGRAARTFVCQGVSREAVGVLSIVLLGLALLCFALLGALPFALALAILGLSALYSAPFVHMKGRPVFSSMLHLMGGALHFLLGYATFSAVDGRGIIIGCFFGLIFAAGHLMHETRGYEGDRLNGILTNAVYFGRTRSFIAGSAMFTVAYVLLIALAVSGLLPHLLVFAILLVPLHLHASAKAIRAGLSFESLLAYQKRYRLLYAVLGCMLVASVVFDWARQWF